MSEPFRVGLSPDVPREGAGLRYDLDLRVLEEAGVPWGFLPEGTGPGRELGAEQLAGIDALFLWGSRLSERSLEGTERLGLVARLGVGYDNVDLDACTRRGIPVTITPDAVRRPMACSAVLFTLALAHNLLQKDRATREGRWDDRWDLVGSGLTGKTLGLLGAGNIGREVFRLAAPFGMRHVAHDPYVTPETAAAEGFELVGLEELFGQADFLVVLCPLTEETRHIVNAERLALMKPTAYLLSMARGPVVDEPALVEVLGRRRIAGAAVDVFEQEPAAAANPLLALDNVIVTPHAIAHTDEFFRTSGRSAANAALAIRGGEAPPYVVNREVLDTSLFHERLERRRAEAGR